MPEPVRIPNVAAIKDYVGQTFGPTDWVDVTQERIQAFADATGDQQWIHTDPERAKSESPFDGTIAHGYLTLSLAPPLVGQLYEIGDLRMTVNTGIERMRLQEPVRAGSRIRLKAELNFYRLFNETIEEFDLEHVRARQSEALGAAGVPLPQRTAKKTA